MRGRWTILGVVLTGAVAAVLLVSGEEDPAQHRLDKALSGHRRKESEYKDDAMVVRPSAADALGKVGPAAKEVVPALIAALKDKDKEVRMSATFALIEIGGAAVPALIAALKDENREMRWRAANALGQIGFAAPDAVRALEAAARDGVEGADSALKEIRGKQ